MPFVKSVTATVVIGVLPLLILLVMSAPTMTAMALIKTVSVSLTLQKELHVGLTQAKLVE